MHLKLGPSAQVFFYSDASRADDGIPTGEASFSDALGPDAMKLEFQGYEDLYVPPPNTQFVTRRSAHSFSDNTTRAATPASAPLSRSSRAEEAREVQKQGAATPTSQVPAASGASSGGLGTRFESSTSGASAGARDVSSKATSDSADGGSREGIIETRSTVDSCPAGVEGAGDLSAENLGLRLSDDWAWHAHLPPDFDRHTTQFVRQHDQEVEVTDGGQQPQDLLQGEWVGETFADGLASGVARSLGAGACAYQYTILTADADVLAVSFDECLEKCGALPAKKCRYLSWHAGEKKCIMYPVCLGGLVQVGGWEEYNTWEIPYSDFKRLTCTVRMVVRNAQMVQHIYNCGEKDDKTYEPEVRHSFQEGFNFNDLRFRSASDNACELSGMMPCTLQVSSALEMSMKRIRKRLLNFTELLCRTR